MIRVAAFDLSLTGTGWCVSDEKMTWGTIDAKPFTHMPRIQFIVNRIATMLPADLVVMEDLAFGVNLPGSSERAGLAYIVRYVMYLRRQKYVLCAPLSLKKFVAGSGKAEKSGMMLAVYKRFTDHDGNQISCATSDEADSVGLCFIGRAMLGEWEPQSKEQREVLAKLKDNS